MRAVYKNYLIIIIIIISQPFFLSLLFQFKKKTNLPNMLHSGVSSFCKNTLISHGLINYIMDYVLATFSERSKHRISCFDHLDSSVVGHTCAHNKTLKKKKMVTFVTFVTFISRKVGICSNG